MSRSAVVSVDGPRSSTSASSLNGLAVSGLYLNNPTIPGSELFSSMWAVFEIVDIFYTIKLFRFLLLVYKEYNGREAMCKSKIAETGNYFSNNHLLTIANNI